MIRRGWEATVRRSGATVLLMCAIGATMTPGEASAQPAAAPAETQVNADARQLFTDGQTATKMLQWDRARTFFQGAWRIQQHWKIAASLGRAELKVGRMRDAAEHLAFALREVPAGALSPEDLKPVQEMLAQARVKVGAVKVTGAPDGAEVSLDGVVMGKAPIKGELFLEPGAHRVEGKRDGYVDGKGEVTAEAGKEAGVDLRMVKVPEVKAVGPVAGAGTVLPEGGPNKKIVIAGVTVAAVAAAAGVGFAVGWGVDNGNRHAKGELCEGACTHMKNLMFWSFVGAAAVGGATLTYTLATAKPKQNGVSQASVWVGQSAAGATFVRSW